MIAMPKGSPDPALQKLAQAFNLIKQANDELGNRHATAHRKIARTYLNQAMGMLRRANDFEGRAL